MTATSKSLVDKSTVTSAPGSLVAVTTKRSSTVVALRPLSANTDVVPELLVMVKGPGAPLDSEKNRVMGHAAQTDVS